ncbi:hypothetical protein PoB_004348200 [Plakobranchus ocellatus]|uniref:Uncharacterized protein n=1 Tax=Plakobranchus ocellatus TaxID=259542 RepID=A0AAV4BCR6_9GAST|nr:hypothetical protein PoB_004348200 [Plakobranchus ocellatus]
MLFVKAYSRVRQTTTNMEPLSTDDDTAAEVDVAPQNSPSLFYLKASGLRAETEIVLDILTKDESSPKNCENANKRLKKSFPQKQA